jgi:hypothetical protein
MLDALRAAKVGGENGGADSGVVADVFFAATQSGATATLATADKGVYNRLAALAGIEPGSAVGPVWRTHPNGFDVTVNGRTIHVLPLAPPAKP